MGRQGPSLVENVGILDLKQGLLQVDPLLDVVIHLLGSGSGQWQRYMVTLVGAG